MDLICPNCTGKVEKERPLDLYVSCDKCGNEWTIVPKFSKLEYLQMIQEEIQKSTKVELSQRHEVDIDELIENILDYGFYTQDIYYKLCKVTGRTMKNIQEYLLIRPEDFETYREDYLRRERIAKES
ncbi:MAG: hypothetical protein M0Q88_03100 [Bacilli bacterium]|nr:hypothetical protein [Bacilli bacterium]